MLHGGGGSWLRNNSQILWQSSHNIMYRQGFKNFTSYINKSWPHQWQNLCLTMCQVGILTLWLPTNTGMIYLFLVASMWCLCHVLRFSFGLLWQETKHLWRCLCAMKMVLMNQTKLERKLCWIHEQQSMIFTLSAKKFNFITASAGQAWLFVLLGKWQSNLEHAWNMCKKGNIR